MTCSSSRTWVYMSMKIPCSPGNSKGGSGWRNCQSWFCVVRQASHATGFPSERSSSFISSPGRLIRPVSKKPLFSLRERIPARPSGFKLILQESPLRVEVAPHALDIILLPQEVKVIAGHLAQIVSTQHRNIRPHSRQGVDSCIQIIQ